MICGSRVLLRPWQRDDIDTFLRWFNDPEVTYYLGDAYPNITRWQEERFIEERVQNKTCTDYCIVLREDGRPIGTCSLFDIDLRHRQAEVGIVIGEKDCWSQGYGREALALLLEIGFAGYGLNRIFLVHVATNERGHRCYLAAGFREEGRLRQANYLRGRFEDDIVMSILAEEYWAAHPEVRRA